MIMIVSLSIINIMLIAVMVLTGIIVFVQAVNNNDHANYTIIAFIIIGILGSIFGLVSNFISIFTLI